MSRTEQFRERRKMRRKLAGVAFLSMTIITGGIFITDYSFNSLAKNDSSIRIISIRQLNNSYYTVELLNRKFYINAAYIKRDINNLKKKLGIAK